MQINFKQRYQNKLDNFSIKKKFFIGFGIVLSFMTLAVIVTMTNLFSMKSNITNVVKEHEPTVIAVIELGQQINQASSALGFYLLSKERNHKVEFKNSLQDVTTTLQTLQSRESIQNDDAAKKLVTLISSKITTFNEYHSKLFELADDDSKNMPGILYSANNLNPISQNILQNVSAMIEIEESESATQKRKKLLIEIESLRYNWTNAMSSLRAYLAFRRAVTRKEITIYLEQVKIQIGKVEKFSGELTFEQSDSLEQIKASLDDFAIKINKVYELHGGEKWRVDAYSIRTEVAPLLDKIHRDLNALQKIQREKIENASDSLIMQSSTTIILSIILLLLAGISAGVITVELIRNIVVPLNDAVNATRKITLGDLSVDLNDSANDEIGQLSKSFNTMVKKFQADIEIEKQNNEDLEGKVSLISDVVELAAKGDLTGRIIKYSDDNFVSELANGVQGMLDNLNNLVSKVQRSGIQVTSSTTEIAATAKQQEATVTEQAATANEISTTAQEISATSQELVNTMGEVTQVVESTANEAAHSQIALNEMESTMHKMMEATANISTKLSVLSEKAANINSVVTTITKVADQTNLLSLNAAIEAEKAGEYGAGFSVVATEIRRLADQTAVATWDIEQMVKEMQTAVSAGVMGMDKFSDEVRGGVNDVQQVGAQLSVIIDDVQALLPSFEAVHEGMQNQALGAQQINESISQLSEGTQQTADSLRQSGGALSQLNDAARSLQSGVSIFKIKSTS